MRFNYELIKEDVRKIGVALVVGSLLASFLKSAGFFEVLYPFAWGMILIFAGSSIKENEDE